VTNRHGACSNGLTLSPLWWQRALNLSLHCALDNYGTYSYSCPLGDTHLYTCTGRPSTFNVACRNETSPACAMWDSRRLRWDPTHCLTASHTADNVTCRCTHLTAYASGGVLDVASILVYQPTESAGIPLLFRLRGRTAFRAGVYVVATAFAAFVASALTCCFYSWR
jgi:hypothetical protein